MMNSLVRKIIAIALLIVSVVMLVVSQASTYKVYDDDPLAAEFGLLTFKKISELELVIDATFTGTTRRDGKLYSTYDRTQVRGKKACPT